MAAVEALIPEAHRVKDGIQAGRVFAGAKNLIDALLAEKGVILADYQALSADYLALRANKEAVDAQNQALRQEIAELWYRNQMLEEQNVARR